MGEANGNEANKAEFQRKLDAVRKKPISQEILDKFSKGDVRVTDRAVIKGEGDERKLHIRIKYNDPAIAHGKNDAPTTAFELSRMHEDPEFKTELSDFGLDVMNLDEGIFQRTVFNKYVFKPLCKIGDGVFERYKKIKKNGSKKAEKQKEELEAQLKENTNLLEYVSYLLKSHNAIVITIEEKPTKLSRAIGLIKKPFLKT